MVLQVTVIDSSAESQHLATLHIQFKVDRFRVFALVAFDLHFARGNTSTVKGFRMIVITPIYIHTPLPSPSLPPSRTFSPFGFLPSRPYLSIPPASL